MPSGTATTRCGIDGGSSSRNASWTQRAILRLGFYELLEVLADPKNPDHADAKKWSADYDPNTFDELPIKYALDRIANRRKAARSRLAKKKPLGSPA